MSSFHYGRIALLRCHAAPLVANTADYLFVVWRVWRQFLLEGYWKTIVSCFFRTKPLLKYQTTGLT